MSGEECQRLKHLEKLYYKPIWLSQTPRRCRVLAVYHGGVGVEFTSGDTIASVTQGMLSSMMFKNSS